MAEYRLTNLHKKIIASVYELSEHGVIATDDGLIAFLNGTVIPEGEYLCSGTMISLTGRRGKSALRTLLHHNFLKRKYLQKEDGYYYLLCDCSLEIAHKVLSSPLKKKKKKTSRAPSLFVKLD